MGAIITLRDEIEAIIHNMDDVQYLRASASEANIRLEQDKIDECVAIHIDQTTVTANNTNINHIVKLIPLEILFVYKNTDIDDKLYDIDKMVDKAEDHADEFFDSLIQSSVISDLETFEDYELQRLESYKRYDTVLSGVLFIWNAPVSRKIYYSCQ